MQLNKRTLLIILFFPFIGLAQPAVPLIRAHGNSITIRDGNTLIQGLWIAQPQYRPDIYRTIRSDSARVVTFYTDLDSITFTLQPGEKKDFVILLNGKDSCFTEVSTLNGTQIVRESGGIFMRPKVWLPIVAFLLVVAGFSVRYRKNLRLPGLLSLGIWIPVVFWIGTIIGGYIHGSYNHFTQVVSELGAVGTRSEVFLSALTILLSMLSLYFIAGLLGACKKLQLNRLPIFTIFSFTIMLFFTGMFPMGNPLHVVTGPIFLFLNLGTLLAVLLWRGPGLRSIRGWSLLSFLLLSVIALKFVGPLQAQYPGLIQRFAHAGWSVWFVSLSLGMKNLIHQKFAWVNQKPVSC